MQKIYALKLITTSTHTGREKSCHGMMYRLYSKRHQQ